jgi:hypothetical protein
MRIPFALTLLHRSILTDLSQFPKSHPELTFTMSFLFGGAPKMSSEQKIAAAETEVEMITDMFNRFVRPYHVNIWQLYITRHS